MIRIRFVEGSEFTSKLIELRENNASPLTPSHVELCVPGGYLGALLDGGVKIRPVGYDKGTWSRELIVTVPGDNDKATAYAMSKLNAPYDWAAILDYMLPAQFNIDGSFICSAIMADVLMAGGSIKRLAAESFLISPRDLLLICSAIALV